MSFALCLLCTRPAISEIVNHGNYFTDTSTNLDWINPDITRHQQSQTVLARMKPGGDLFGWTYATSEQASNLLFTMLGSIYDLPSQGPTICRQNSCVREVVVLNGTFGASWVQPFFNVFGVSAQSVGAGSTPEHPWMNSSFYGQLSGQDLLIVSNDFGGLDGGATFEGFEIINQEVSLQSSMLVRQTASVPEASPQLLFLIGLFGLAFFMTRKANLKR